MRVQEQHRNGAKIEVRGTARKVARALEEWRARQDPPEEEDPGPKVFGASTSLPGSSHNDSWAGQGRYHHRPDVQAIGFAPDPEKE